MSPERRREVQLQVFTGSAPRGAYYVMAMLSAIIAAYGLLANSTAVVIGAMLVAPLMGPIFGIGLGLASGDRKMLYVAVVGEVTGVAVVLGASVVIGLMPWRMEFGSEIIGRTQPTLYDLVVALASGVAGAYACCNERVGSALPGVAIATALVPPLATSGLCMAAGEWSWALGAFLLFLANFLAIELAAATVFSAYGLTGRPEAAQRLRFSDLTTRYGVSLVALLAIGAYLTSVLVGLAHERTLHARMSAILSAGLNDTAGAVLTDLSVHPHDGRLEATAIVQTPSSIEAQAVDALQERLRAACGAPVLLTVRSVVSRDFNAEGPAFLSPDSEALARITDALRRQVSQLAGATLSDVRRESAGDAAVVTADVRAPTAVEPEQVARMQEALRREAGSGLRLVVRSIVTRDASAEGYVYARGDQAALDRASAAIEREIARLPGARLASLHGSTEADAVELTAVVEAPEAVAPPTVGELRDAVSAEIGRDTRLVVRSVITRDADSERFIDWDPGGRAALTQEEADLHTRVEESLTAELGRRLKGATLSETRCAERDARLVVFAAVRAPTVCDARMVRLLESALRKDVDERVDLTVRSVVGADATSSGYIGRFDEWTLTDVPSPPEPGEPGSWWEWAKDPLAGLPGEALHR